MERMSREEFEEVLKTRDMNIALGNILGGLETYHGIEVHRAAWAIGELRRDSEKFDFTSFEDYEKVCNERYDLLLERLYVCFERKMFDI